MNKFHFLIAIFCLLLFGCSQIEDEPIDESVLSDLPNFEYKGYRYYVHSRLSIHGSHEVKYSEISSEVKALDSYGLKWVIPTMDEMERAIESGLVEPMSNGNKLFYMTSSTDGGRHILLYNNYEGRWLTCLEGSATNVTVMPMVKFRK